jgi:hypothetical protein
MGAFRNKRLKHVLNGVRFAGYHGCVINSNAVSLNNYTIFGEFFM